MAKKDQESRALSKPAGKHGARPVLSDEERALWEHAARTLKPLKEKKQRVASTREETAGGEVQRVPEPEGRGVDRKPRVAPPRSINADKPTIGPPPLSDLERRKARQIASGRIDIEARIDLHGKRQSEAHAALRRFLLNAHAKGCRWVLVITGKGGALRRAETADEGEMGAEPERGVLRRNVPRWLAEPELRAIVIGFAPAAIRHGGDGALYVQLRKRDRA